MSVPVRREDGTLSRARQSPLVAPELSTNASTMAPGVILASPMKSGVNGVNIDLPPPKARPFSGDVAIKEMRGRWLLDPDLFPQPPIRSGRKAVVLWIGALSFILSAIGVVFGPTVLTFLDEARKQVGGIAMTPLAEGSSRAGTPAHPARLVVESQKGFTNEPLPLGLSLNDASGGETLTLAGLAAGTKLTVGTPLGLAGWQVSARDLDKA